ncbi:copper resistance protein CopC [Phenylobacterium hankyongense]|uniref:Copper resistance protein CopC n=2 Tax=Phenylobacterium hankyongense TaxID=1813876 RepID=A0A328B4H5_9CAUL|nr:copper resistance protein CopC [Phenylobacterium hankyongense]
MSLVRFSAGAMGAALVLAASQAAAHAHLVASDPAQNATVAAPKQITLHFSETLHPKFSGFDLSLDGAPVPVKAKIAKDTMVGTPAKPLKAGAYQIKWHAVTPDTHRMEGLYTFTVR